MGRIKTKLIKRVTHEIIDKYGEKLTDDYTKNKVVINQHLKTESKKIKNIVAGYSTRLTKSRAQ